AGGKFMIALPYSGQIEEKVQAWKEEIEKWLWLESWGELYLNLALLRCRGADLSSDFSEKVALRIQGQLDEGKLRMFLPILQPGRGTSGQGWEFDYPIFRVRFNEECHSCHVLPARKEKSGDNENLCSQCNRFEEFGRHSKAMAHSYLRFRSGNRRGAINFHDNYLVPVDHPTTLPRIAAYVPQWQDFHWIDRSECSEDRTSDNKKELLCSRCSLQESKPNDCDPDWLATRFHCLATLAEVRGGASKIAVLAADGDSFSYHFNSTAGITLEDQVVLGKLVYAFFCDHLIEVAKAHDCLLIYSGGDDFVIVGPWASVIDAVDELRTKFSEWTLGRLHFSCGVFIANPGRPIYGTIRTAQDMLDEAKAAPGKNAVQITDTCVPWPKFDEVYDLARTLADAVERQVISTGFIYGLYQIYGQYELFDKRGDVRGLRYLGRLASFVTRNLKLEWDDSPEKAALAAKLHAKFSNHLFIPNDEELLPYLRFALDWASLKGRGGRRHDS
ncbi:MAG: type III-A CRISPR-associated protein Cas10/Csm1, partial [Blastocatellia bacterium]